VGYHFAHCGLHVVVAVIHASRAEFEGSGGVDECGDGVCGITDLSLALWEPTFMQGCPI